MKTATTEAIKVFYSYAQNPQDEHLFACLEKHLSLLEKTGHIKGWHRQEVLAGSDMQSESSEQFDKAQLILLLVSSDFLASPYCYGTEMMRAIERHNAGDARIILILLRPVDLVGAPFTGLERLPRNNIPITQWPDLDAAFKNVAKGIRKAIEAMTTPSIIQPVKSGWPKVWNIPYPQNIFFTGREALLQQLHDTLASDRTAILTPPCAICGLGGIGKTQTAIEYAYRYYAKYRAVLWAKATTRDTLISDFGTLAELLRISKKDVPDQNVLVVAVKEWLVNHLNWLLILDDVDDLDMIRDFLPFKGAGHVLLTTRQHSIGGIASRIPVEIMGLEEGTQLLLRRSGLLDQVSEVERTEAKKIVKAVDGLPLALNQAGAYIDKTGCSLSAYLNLYRTRFTALSRLPGGNKLSVDYPHTVATTWSLSFQKVEQENSASAALLLLCAFLAPYTIPEEIITQGAAYLGDELSPIVDDEIKLNETMEVLQRYSLVRRYPVTSTLTVHCLVQAVLKDRMDPETGELWAMRAVHAVNAAFPEVTYETWGDCQRYLPHAQACAELVEKYQIFSPEAAGLLTQTGWYLRERGMYAQAEPLLMRALLIRERVLDPLDPDIATSCNNLSQLYRLQGKYKQAEDLCQRALVIREQVLGPLDSAVAFTLHDLGHLYYFQGEFKKAEPFYLRALAIREQMSGPLHPYTATTLNHLGMLYHSLGKYEKAEKFYQRALEIRKQVLDPKDPLIATAQNGLALLYYAQGKYKKAEQYYECALKIRKHALGPKHHHTTITLNHLGMLYQEQGKYDLAEVLHQRVLSIRKQTLGSEHPDIAFTLNDLAHLYHLQGRYTLAEELYQRALTLKEQKIGLQHPGTATTLSNLACLYRDQGRFDKARDLFKRALTIRAQTLGIGHPHILTTLNDLALLYQLQGLYSLAEALYQFVLKIRKQVLGQEHPHTATTLNNLASLYHEQGRHSPAEVLYKQALAIRTKVLDPGHPDVAITLNNLARLYRE